MTAVWAGSRKCPYLCSKSNIIHKRNVNIAPRYTRSTPLRAGIWKSSRFTLLMKTTTLPPEERWQRRPCTFVRCPSSGVIVQAVLSTQAISHSPFLAEHANHPQEPAVSTTIFSVGVKMAVTEDKEVARWVAAYVFCEQVNLKACGLREMHYTVK